MPVMTLRGMGKAGMLRDAPLETLPLEAFHAARNVRFHPSYVERVRGDDPVFAGATDEPQWMLFWPSPTDFVWFYGSDTKLWKVDTTGTHIDVTRASGPYAVSSNAYWTGGTLGGVPFANYGPSVDVPQSWDFASTKFVDLPNWPADTSCNVMRAHKTFLFAANLLIDGQRFSQVVRWSSPASPGTLPASWDIADPATVAGEVSLGATPGAVLDMAPWQDHMIVFKSDAVYGMQFTGGQEVFRTWLMFDDVGLLCPNAWANLPIGQIFVTQGNVVLHNGQRWESIIDRKNREWLFNSMNPTHFARTVVVRNVQLNEVWIAFPSTESTSGALDRALVWNWKDNTFSVRELPDVSFLLPSTRPVVGDSDLWNESNTTWNESDLFWNNQLEFNSNFVVLMASKLPKTFHVAGQGLTIDGVAHLGYAERYSLPMINGDQADRPALDLQTRVLVQAIYPQVEGEGPVSFYFGKQESLRSGITWQGPYTFNPATQRKIDLLMNTRFFSYRIEGSQYWRFYGLDIKFAQNGST